MRFSLLKLAVPTVLFALTAGSAMAQFHSPQIDGAKHKKDKKQYSDAEWMWQYGPPPTEGRENQLIQDARFYPFLKQSLTAPQSFWGVQGTKYKPLADTAMDFLSVPGKVTADDDRYLTITGCVFHFCPSRGMLWVDLNAAPKAANLVAFAAVDWIRDSKTTSEPDAEYTLWLFGNQAFGLSEDAPNKIPSALVRSISRWTKEPIAGSTIVQKITHAIVVDPDGTPHQIPIAALGITLPRPQPATDTQ
jgi:hypothetical protein